MAKREHVRPTSKEKEKKNLKLNAGGIGHKRKVFILFLFIFFSSFNSFSDSPVSDRQNSSG